MLRFIVSVFLMWLPFSYVSAQVGLPDSADAGMEHVAGTTLKERTYLGFLEPEEWHAPYHIGFKAAGSLLSDVNDPGSFFFSQSTGLFLHSSAFIYFRPELNFGIINATAFGNRQIGRRSLPYASITLMGAVNFNRLSMRAGFNGGYSRADENGFVYSMGLYGFSLGLGYTINNIDIEVRSELFANISGGFALVGLHLGYIIE